MQRILACLKNQVFSFDRALGKSYNFSQIRFATKKSGGSTSNGRTSNPKFLGFKKGHNSIVKAGNIILRQRGTEWHPAKNVGIGKDHTIFAMVPGKVLLHFDLFRQRRLISVVDTDQTPTIEYASKKVLKDHLKNVINVPEYLELDARGRYDHVQQKLKELEITIKQQIEADHLEELYKGSSRKANFVDLTSIS